MCSLLSHVRCVAGCDSRSHGSRLPASCSVAEVMFDGTLRRRRRGLLPPLLASHHVEASSFPLTEGGPVLPCDYCSMWNYSWAPCRREVDVAVWVGGFIHRYPVRFARSHGASIL